MLPIGKRSRLHYIVGGQGNFNIHAECKERQFACIGFVWRYVDKSGSRQLRIYNSRMVLERSCNLTYTDERQKNMVRIFC